MLGINFNQSKLNMPQKNNRQNNTPSLKSNALVRDTVSFSGVAARPLTNADAYLAELGSLVKSFNSEVAGIMEAYASLVEPSHVDRIKAEHARLLADPNVKTIVKQIIQDVEPQLADGNYSTWENGRWVPNK